MILRLNGKIIHVHRNSPEWVSKYKQGEYPKETECIHRSELEWIRCYNDYEIENNGSIEELYERIKQNINYIMDKTT
jgi:hypothetical protein